jgi:hypothetical protein
LKTMEADFADSKSYRISWEEQDAFALANQRRAQAALASADVGVGVEGGGSVEVVARDEPPRGIAACW